MFNLFGNGSGAAENAPTSSEVEVIAASTPAEPVEREILKDFAAQRDAARKHLASCENAVGRLEAVVEQGELASAAMKASIASDGGAALEALARGEPDPAMTRLVGAEMAARTATEALPAARRAVEEAKAARERAEVEVAKAARNLMLTEAVKKGAEYSAHFAPLGRLFDELVAISAALPPMEQLGTEIANTVVGFSIPAFNLGGDYSVQMTHRPDDRLVAQSTASWTAAKEAVIADPDADFREVLSKPAEPVRPIGSAPAGVTRGINPFSGQVGDGVPMNNFGLPVSPFFKF